MPPATAVRGCCRIGRKRIARRHVGIDHIQPVVRCRAEPVPPKQGIGFNLGRVRGDQRVDQRHFVVRIDFFNRHFPDIRVDRMSVDSRFNPVPETGHGDVRAESRVGIKIGRRPFLPLQLVRDRPSCGVRDKPAPKAVGLLGSSAL